MATRKTLPVMPLRDIVVFPHMAAPLFVGREKSVRALDEVMRNDKQILLAAQMDAAEDDPKPDRIYSVGALATIVQLLKLPDGTVRVLVEGATRAKIVKFVDNDEYFEAEIEPLDETNIDTPEARGSNPALLPFIWKCGPALCALQGVRPDGPKGPSQPADSWPPRE